MALQDIINTIKKDAKKQADNIRSRGKKDIQAIREKGKKLLQDEIVKIEKEIEKEGNKVINKARLESNIEERNQIVLAKRELVDEIFSKALENISNLDDNQQIQILASLINQLPDVKNGEIVSAVEKKEITRKALDQSNKNFLVTENEFPGIGGFIFKSSKIEVNNSYEELLKNLREKIEVEISKKLFVGESA